MSAEREIWCPSAGRDVSAYREYLLSAVRGADPVDWDPTLHEAWLVLIATALLAASVPLIAVALLGVPALFVIGGGALAVGVLLLIGAEVLSLARLIAKGPFYRDRRRDLLKQMQSGWGLRRAYAAVRSTTSSQR